MPKLAPYLRDLDATSAYRLLSLPERDRCGIPLSQVIESAEELGQLRSELRALPSRGASPLGDAPDKLTIDFTREALVLLRHTEPYGGTTAELETPHLTGGVSGSSTTLGFRMRVRRPPSNTPAFAAVVPYCYPVIVDRSKANMVVFSINDRAIFATRLTSPIAANVSD